MINVGECGRQLVLGWLSARVRAAVGVGAGLDSCRSDRPLRALIPCGRGQLRELAVSGWSEPSTRRNSVSGCSNAAATDGHQADRRHRTPSLLSSAERGTGSRRRQLTNNRRIVGSSPPSSESAGRRCWSLRRRWVCRTHFAHLAYRTARPFRSLQHHQWAAYMSRAAWIALVMRVKVRSSTWPTRSPSQAR